MVSTRSVHLTVACFLYAIVLVAGNQSTGAHATIRLKDGGTLEGQLQGRIVLAQPRPGRILVLVDGSRVTGMDTTGLAIQSGTVVTRIGLPLTSSPEIYRDMTDEALISVALDAADKKEPGKAPFELLLEAGLRGKVDGPGIGSVPVAGGRGWAFFLRELTADKVVEGRWLVLGELQRSARATNISPTLRLMQNGVIRAVPVASVTPLAPDQTPNR